MVEGRTFDFDEALELGLVNKIFEGEDEEYFAAVMEYAKQFVPPGKASRAVGRIKRAVCSGVEVPFSEGLGDRARASAAALPGRGREGGSGRVRGPSRSAVRRKVMSAWRRPGEVPAGDRVQPETTPAGAP